MAFALFGTALCVACEKEESLNNPQTVSTIEQTAMDDLLHEAYTAAHNNSPITITVSSKEANTYLDRCRELFGGSVLIATQHNKTNSNYTDITLIATHTALAKKIWQHVGEVKAVPFSTKDKTEWQNWRTEMENNKYVVIGGYDEKTGTHHGVAYTREEWDKLQ